ncbi:MAG: LysM peptidoglycan-binding domain-containing protein [Opitutales bacterium]|nr:LysM peptidoglycan-binding domain-containing protein [Opitutales bacterium]
MKAPITIAVIALHLAIVATILVPGCKSSGDSELNPEVTRSQAKATSHNKASELSRTRAAKAKPAEDASSAQAVKDDDSVAILDSQPQEGSEDFRASPMRPIATLEDEMFASDQTFETKKDSEKLAPKQAAKPAGDAAEEKTYIVQKGDSLSKIASTHGVNLSILMEANGLNRKSVIKVGQKIIIPAASAKPEEKPAAAQPEQNSETVVYVVQKGDNLSKIASKYNTSVAAIMEANGMTKSSINIGRKLKIPTGSKAAASEKKAAAPKKSGSQKYEGKLIHEVKSGDTLGGISIKYGVPMKTLMEQNGIKDARKIRVGQILVIKDKPANTDAAFEDKKPEAEKPAETKADQQAPAAQTPQTPSDIPSDAVNQTQQQDIPSL